MRYTIALEDDIWTVFRGDTRIGRAVSQADAGGFADALNGTGADIRQRILDGVNDAIEGVFDEAT